MFRYTHDQVGDHEHPLLDPADDHTDGFDWMATLAAAGIPSRERDLTDMEADDIIALLVGEETAAASPRRPSRASNAGGKSRHHSTRLARPVRGRFTKPLPFPRRQRSPPGRKIMDHAHRRR